MAKVPNAHDLDELVQHSLGNQGLRTVLDWVARFTYWVSPEVYQEVQVVYPKVRRMRGSKERFNEVVGGYRVMRNEPAQAAFWLAYGGQAKGYRNAVICHIYDGSVQDPMHFTNLANLAVFPKSLESVSEWPPVQAVLKWHSYKLYRYKGPTNKVPAQPSYYPAHWDGMRELTSDEVEHIVAKLQHQRTTRPSFRRAGEPEAQEVTS